MADALLWAACRKAARASGTVWQEWLRRAMQAALEAKNVDC